MIDPDYVLFGTELAVPDSLMRKLHASLMRGRKPPKPLLDEIKRCNQERDRALTSMDKDKILAYASKHDVNMANLPLTDERFWAAVHICISGVETLPMPMRKVSKRWLIERGMPVLDDGKVQA